MTMHPSKINYYGDFVVYPALIVAFTTCRILVPGTTGLGLWILAAILGCAGWTLVEYALHRVAFHALGPMVLLHAQHHGHPRALLGAPTWLTLATIVFVLLVPTGYSLSWNVGFGIATGFMTGYLWYVLIHHLVHHHAPRKVPRRFQSLRRHHLLHHQHGGAGNFGVTSGFWDRVFHTTLRPRLNAIRYDQHL